MRWVPKVKNRSVSFVDPVITSIQPSDASVGHIIDESYTQLRHMNFAIQAALQNHVDATFKVTAPYDLGIFDVVFQTMDERVVVSTLVSIISGIQLANETIEGTKQLFVRL